MSKLKLTLDEKIILALCPLKEILSIFSTLFLTAYFVKISTESLQVLSIYNILAYLMLLIASFIFSLIMSRNFKLQTLRLGILMNIIYFAAIIILKENLIYNIPLVAFLYGFSAGAYWMPMHSIIGHRINNNHRTKYTTLSFTISQVANIVVPFLLGLLITVSDFIVAATVVLVISIFQIVLSFLITPEPKTTTQPLRYKELIKIIKKNKHVRALMTSNIFMGLSISGSALQVIIILLIIEYYKTDFNLGTITSIAALVSVAAMTLYGKIFSKISDRFVVLALSIGIIIPLALFIYFRSGVLLIIFYALYFISILLLRLMRGIRAYNISDQKALKGLSGEYWSLLEFFLNLGRILGFLLLFVVSIIGEQIGFTIALIVLTACIPIHGVFLWRIKKFENNL